MNSHLLRLPCTGLRTLSAIDGALQASWFKAPPPVQVRTACSPSRTPLEPDSFCLCRRGRRRHDTNRQKMKKTIITQQQRPPLEQRDTESRPKTDRSQSSRCRTSFAEAETPPPAQRRLVRRLVRSTRVGRRVPSSSSGRTPTSERSSPSSGRSSPTSRARRSASGRRHIRRSAMRGERARPSCRSSSPASKGRKGSASLNGRTPICGIGSRSSGTSTPSCGGRPRSRSTPPRSGPAPPRRGGPSPSTWGVVCRPSCPR